ncbi:MAG: tetratricopeptide repeat protein [Acetobacteraceae bacterium]|nr:tetratricopeptide repeat protein [Acetobacteraceae bacterium]
MIRDAQEQAVTGATAESVALYDQAVRAFNLVCGDTLRLFDAARQASPGFVMAHLAKAWAFALARDPGLTAQVRTLIETAAPLAMNERESAHLAALRHVADGALHDAVLVLDRHLMRYPFDMVAHQVALLLDLLQGRVRWMRDRTARALRVWSPDMPGYPVLRALHAFGLEENGDYARAEAESRAALEGEPLMHWPHHTVSHVMEMTGRPEDGLGWMLAREASWSTKGHANQAHIWWHRALFHIELGQYDEALALYDGPIRATQRPIGVSLTNASALLWRLSTIGHDVGDRWRDVLTTWDGHADGRHGVFNDLHAAMAELGAGEAAATEQRLTAMRDTAESDNPAAATYREAGVPLVEGLLAFHRGAYEQAVATLVSARFELWRIGGSHAQRDVVDWTLTEAAIRGGLRDTALSLAHERLAARPRDHVNRLFLSRAEGIAA